MSEAVTEIIILFILIFINGLPMVFIELKNSIVKVEEAYNDNLKNYRIGEMAHTLYDFFWNSYCDWYVEIAKIQLQDADLKTNTQRVLRYVLDMSLR